MSASSASGIFKNPDIGLFLLRVGAGITMVMHGLPKYLGGADTLTAVGKAISIYGLPGSHLAWGFAAATVEVFGGAMIVLGVLFRTSAFALVCVMLTALLSLHPQLSLSAFGGYAHAAMMLTVFLALFFTGPGSYSMDGGSKSSGKSSAKTPPAGK